MSTQGHPVPCHKPLRSQEYSWSTWRTAEYQYRITRVPIRYSTLDDCGGHSHGTYGYHYHSQVITAYTSTGAAKGVNSNTAYAVFPPGPFKFWRVRTILRVLGVL